MSTYLTPIKLHKIPVRLRACLVGSQTTPRLNCGCHTPDAVVWFSSTLWPPRMFILSFCSSGSSSSCGEIVTSEASFLGATVMAGVAVAWPTPAVNQAAPKSKGSGHRAHRGHSQSPTHRRSAAALQSEASPIGAAPRRLPLPVPRTPPGKRQQASSSSRGCARRPPGCRSAPGAWGLRHCGMRSAPGAGLTPLWIYY
jgi:hypothetical protein